MDLETLIHEHGNEEFIEADSRINKKKLERKDGVFWYKPKSADSPVLLIPPKFRTNIISDVHDLGHSGVKRCCREVRRSVF